MVVTPDGTTERPRSRIGSAFVKAIARTHRWQRMLERGESGSITELAAAEKIDRSYLCRVLRLTLLAPEIVEATRSTRSWTMRASQARAEGVGFQDSPRRSGKGTAPRTVRGVQVWALFGATGIEGKRGRPSVRRALLAVIAERVDAVLLVAACEIVLAPELERWE